MPQLVEVRFKGNRKAYFEWHEPEPLKATEPVIVESERGLDYGLVSALGAVAQQKCDRCQSCALGGERERDGGEAHRRPPEPTRKVIRRANPGDKKTHDDLRRGEDDVRRKVREKAGAHNLPMKISDAEWQWDRNKLTVFFTADKRVDFRNLVRDLAAQFRTRIELRQIGVRDEAARLNGIGRCGRELCSASWLPELRPIGLHIAKDQRLSLNPAQISGPCGRLLCCLRYEHEFYVQSRKRFPKEGKIIATSKGFEKVYSVDIFRDRVTVRAEDGTSRTVPLVDLKAEMEAALAGGAVVPAAAQPARPPRPEGRAKERGGPPRPEGRARQEQVVDDPRPEGRARQEQVVNDSTSPRADERASPPRPEGRARQEQVVNDSAAQTPADSTGADGEPRKRRRRRRRRKGPRGPGGPGENPSASGPNTGAGETPEPEGGETPEPEGGEEADEA